MTLTEPNFKQLKREIETGDSRIRSTRTKCAIMGAHANGVGEKIEIVKKRYGVKISWRGHIPVQTTDSQRCDLDHFHPVVRQEAFVWNYCELTLADVERLREFLQ